MCGMKGGGILSRSRCSESTPKVVGGLNNATVRIMGNLGRLPDGTRIDRLSVEAPTSVRKLLQILHDRHGVDLRRDSTLVLVNGVEANALDDLDTEIGVGYEVVLIPMFHGG